MALHAWKDGETTINEANMNAFLALQNFKLIYQGTQRSGKTGSGVTENNLANYSYCTRFTLTGSTEISRVELEVDRDGNGADLIVQIRQGMVPGSGNDGTLLKEVCVPKEFVPDPKGWWSVPVGLTGLTSGGQYWLVVLQGGDSVNHNDWVGETSTDSSYPAYRRAGSNGNWTANNALHFRVHSGVVGGDRPIHALIPGGTIVWMVHDAQGIWERVYIYCPTPDTYEGGIRQRLKINQTNGLVTSLEVV